MKLSIVIIAIVLSLQCLNCKFLTTENTTLNITKKGQVI